MASSFPTNEQNAAALNHFIYLPVSQDMISYLAVKATQVIRCEGNKDQSLPPTPPATPPPGSSFEASLPTVEEFITSLVERSSVQVPTLMTSLVYLSRLQQRLPPVAKGMRCTVHRIFLASLILAAKSLNDSSPKNKHWARYTVVKGYEGFGFSLTEVNLMEKQLLNLLQWDLIVREQDLYTHLEPFLAPIRSWQTRQAEKAKQAMLRERLLEEQRQLSERMRQRSVKGDAVYESPRSYRSPSGQESRQASVSRSIARIPSRTPSLSPPSRSNSALTVDSCETSPSNSVSSPAHSEVAVRIQRMPSIVDITMSKLRSRQPSMEQLSQEPQKKLKTGNIFSRLISGSSIAH
ncbi:hypothetical protein BDZ85DRAFT_86162 [Elsinoe ampelina]|uniref:Cyclin N-terminal domain-containing protein n=1 Tax=Elsinoe ampelina TaxID=302913 RepID=A0A6A6GHI2_9PEZI|nr:hypothetical protein BDZ85DRAFT_86162 [Elsinoe ampelina]